jgi:hypothetical protein
MSQDGKSTTAPGDRPQQASFKALLGWILICWVPAAALVCLVAWKWAPPGTAAIVQDKSQKVLAAAVGAGIALAVILASGAIILRASTRGRQQAAMTFVSMAMIRALAAAGIAAAVTVTTSMEAFPLLGGMIVPYLAAHAGECAWLIRLLRTKPPAGAQGAEEAPC